MRVCPRAVRQREMSDYALGLNFCRQIPGAQDAVHKAPTNPGMMWEIVQLSHSWTNQRQNANALHGTMAWLLLYDIYIYIKERKGSPPGSSFSSIKNKLYFEYPIFNRKASLSNTENKTFPAAFLGSVLNKASAKEAPKGWWCAGPPNPLCPFTQQSWPLCRPVQVLHICTAVKCISEDTQLHCSPKGKEKWSFPPMKQKRSGGISWYPSGMNLPRIIEVCVGHRGNLWLSPRGIPWCLARCDVRAGPTMNHAWVRLNFP